MRKPWWHRWRWLFALLAGVGAWWGVGWLLDPRPLYTLRYLDNGEIEKDGSQHFGPRPPMTIGRYGLNVSFFDREGMLLLIMRPHVPILGRVSFELIRVVDGTLVATHSWSAKEADELALFLLSTFGFPQADIDGDPDGVLLAPWHSTIGSTKYRPCLRKYDFAKGNVQDVFIPPSESDFRISRDGTILALRTPWSPQLPALLAPSHTLSTLANLLALKEQTLDTLGPQSFRIYSLPEMHVTSSFMVNSPVSKESWALTNDGQYVVLHGCRLPGNWTSSSHITSEASHIGYVTQHYALPHSIRIYESQTGRLYYHNVTKGEVVLPHHFAANWGTSDLLDFVHFQLDQNQNEAKQTRRDWNDNERSFLFLPTLTWRNPVPDTNWYYPDVITEGAKQNLRWASAKHEDGVYQISIHHKEVHGEQLVKHSLVTRGWTYLVPGSNQVLALVPRGLSSQPWVRELALNQRWLGRWLDDDAGEWVVYDYDQGRMIWKAGVKNDTSTWPSVSRPRSHFLSHKLSNGVHELSVYQLPMASWSPWWSRVASLLAAVLVWRLLRMRRVG